MPEQFPRPGDKIAGKYRILGRLGQGGMGVVFLAEHERLGRQVAIKVLHAQMERPEVAMARFEREIRAMAQVNSRHVAQAFDADVLEDGSPFLVMEYLEGRDLRAELKLRGAIPYPEAVAYIVQTCEGVAAVHDVGIIHRDLKPNNLFITKLDAARCVKVLDFGIVKLLTGTDASMTAENSSVGTPLYMSPEQLNNEEGMSPCSDVWAMGVVLYELIAGVSPFSARRPGAVIAAIMLEQPPPLSRIVPGVPESLAQTIAEALAKSSAERIGSARELATRLAPFGMPTDSIVIAPNTPSGSPVALSRRDSLRPDLAERIQNEVERRDALVKRDSHSRVDELRHLPSLARLSIPLTNVQVPLAGRAALGSARGGSGVAAPVANLCEDTPTRPELPSNAVASGPGFRTCAETVATAPHRWRTRGSVTALLLLGFLGIGFALKSPKSNSIGPLVTPTTPKVAAPQAAPSVALATTTHLGPTSRTASPEALASALASTNPSAARQGLETAPTAPGLAPNRAGTSIGRTKTVGARPITFGDSLPGGAGPRPSAKDANPVHL